TLFLPFTRLPPPRSTLFPYTTLFRSGIGQTATNSSLASQAVGPPNNPTEMSCEGRTFNVPNSLAAKMLARTPLRQQFAHPQDSVLGGITNWPNPGLSRSYTQLISDAYGPAVAANAANTFS